MGYSQELACFISCFYLLKTFDERIVMCGLQGYIFYAGGSIAGVSCRRRWPPPTTPGLTMLVAQCKLSGR